MTQVQESNGANGRIKVWDGWVRVTHWLLALSILGAWLSIEFDLISWHQRFGLLVLGLVVFRLIWGLVGSSTARFSDFLAGPRAVIGYAKGLIRGKPARQPGHNPMGGWMVLFLLLAPGIQASLGLFANDDILFEGPLMDLVSKDWSDTLTGFHADWFDVLAVLIFLHIGAAFFYLIVPRENLIGAMFSGRKSLEDAGGPSAPSLRMANPILGLVLAALVAGGMAWFFGDAFMDGLPNDLERLGELFAS